MARMPPRKAAATKVARSKEPVATATTTRGRTTSASRSTRSSPAKKESPPKQPLRSGPARKKRGDPSSSPEKKKEEETQVLPPPTIKESPSKKSVQVPPKEQEAAKEKVKKPSLHDDSSDSDEDEKDNTKEETKLMSPSPKKILESKINPNPLINVKQQSHHHDDTSDSDEEEETKLPSASPKKVPEPKTNPLLKAQKQSHHDDDDTSDSDEEDLEDDQAKTTLPSPRPKKTLEPKTNPLLKVQKQPHRDDTSGSDDEDDNKEKAELHSTPKKVQESKTNPSPSPKRHSKSKASDMSISGDDDEDHDLEDVSVETDNHILSGKVTKAKAEDLTEGMNVFSLMDSKEIEELLERIDKQCSPTDNFAVRKRENAIDWEQVAFSSYGDQQCRAVWIYLKHHTRTYRIMSEVVNEVKYKFLSDKTFQTKLIESLPGFPQKPPNSLGGFYCFNREQWKKTKDAAVQAEQNTPNFVKFQRECRVQFDALPKQVKEKYEEQAQLAMAEYKRQVKKFYAENPGLAQYISKLGGSGQRSHSKVAKVRMPKQKRQRNPSVAGTSRHVKSEWIDPYEDAPKPPQSPAVTYMQAKLNSIEPPPTHEQLPDLKQSIYEKWKSLSDRKRAKWIGYCVDQCVSYLESSKEYQETHPGYDIRPLKVKQLIPAEEMTIWEMANGKPSNHKQTAYDMFLEEFLQSEEDAELNEDQRRAAAHAKWEKLEWFEKQMCIMNFKVSQLNYKNSLQQFYAKVPPFMKDICLKKIPKKFWKTLEVVDKVPLKSELSEPANELLITAEEGVVYNDNGHKKRKKSKKRKRMNDDEEQNDNELNQEVIYGGEDEFMEGHSYLGEHESDPPPKKKKKKKKHTEHDERDYEHYQNQDTDGYPLQGGQYSQATEKAKKIANLHKEEMMRAGDRVAVTLDEDFVQKHKQSSKHFPENNTLTKNDIYESIRGIFDARALGRKFSIYYYYARHVASEKLWIDSINSSTLAKTATEIIRTFLSLPAVQQDIFIQQSYAYHEAKRHTQGFPNEPKPPLRFAKNLYRKQAVEKKKRDPTFVAPIWTELSDAGQLYYTKQLYHETKLYMRRYDAFISSLTPSDFVDYAIHKYKNWEANLYTQQSVTRAFRSFVFPMTSTKEIGVDVKKEPIRGVDGDLNWTGTNFPCTSKRARDLYNPFITNTAVDAMLKSQSKSSERQFTQSLSDSDSEDMKGIHFSLLLDKDDVFRRKLKRAEMYDYPLEDILAPTKSFPNGPTPRDKRLKNISEGTQTTLNIGLGLLEFVSVATQTQVNDFIINII